LGFVAGRAVCEGCGSGYVKQGEMVELLLEEKMA
jgi:hypothetical protein